MEKSFEAARAVDFSIKGVDDSRKEVIVVDRITSRGLWPGAPHYNHDTFFWIDVNELPKDPDCSKGPLMSGPRGGPEDPPHVAVVDGLPSDLFRGSGVCEPPVGHHLSTADFPPIQREHTEP